MQQEQGNDASLGWRVLCLAAFGWGRKKVILINNTVLFTFYFLAPTSIPAAEVEVCMTFLRFSVVHNMAPLGRLLVYYVRENGEGVTDSLQFTVKSSFENQVLAV